MKVKCLKVVCASLLFLSHIAVSGELEKKADECIASLYDRPEFIQVTRKMGAPDIKAVTFEQLASPEKASEQDKAVISKLATEITRCNEMKISALQKENIYQPIIDAFAENQFERKSSMLELYTQKITYGEYIKQRQRSKQKLDLAIAKGDKEVEENNKKIEALNRLKQSQDLANAFGGIADGIRNSRPQSLNCSSYSLGGTINTTCR